MNSVLGPNTNLPRDFLKPKTLLCCGEDSQEFLAAIEECTGQKFEVQSSYRCYRFWRFPDFLAAWTGIGTGCIEPLLFELLMPQKIKRIALVGTAGKFAHSRVDLIKAHICDPARCSYTALDKLIGGKLLRPKLPAGAPDLLVPHAGIVSTDLFYGFSNDAMKAAFPLFTPALARAFHDDTSQMDLIDMEVGQFYFLSEKYGGLSLDAYIAFKGAANEMGKGQQQLANSQTTISECVQAALTFLGR